MFKRNILNQLNATLEESPVVFIRGARQSGKTTLIENICQTQGYSYNTFDDLFSQGNAEKDPSGFIENLKKPAAIDEVQRVPQIFLPMKKDVDEHRLPGRYLLTGSVNPLRVPNLGDSLAGRMQFIQLWPLSQGEIRGLKEGFIDYIFKEGKIDFPSTEISKDELLNIVIKGGFPDLQRIEDERKRQSWCHGYISTVLEKDIMDLAKIEHLRSMPNILVTLANRLSCTLNEKDVARTVGLPSTTTQRYMQLLQNTYMIELLPAWSRNLEKRMMKSPKVYFVDTALLLHILRFNEERLKEDQKMWGHVVENFVLVEVLKQLNWSEVIAKAYHYRTHDGSEEVDIVLESSSGKIVGIEITSSPKITSDDFNSLRKLQEMVGKNFVRGIILYTGEKSYSAGVNLNAIPISTLWSHVLEIKSAP